MSWGFLIITVSCSLGIAAGGFFILLCGLAGILDRLERRKEQKQEEQYRERWKVWGTITQLRKAS